MPFGATFRAATGAAIMLAVGQADPARAQDFYQGRTISLVVGVDPGSAYDQYGRLLARHMARHIAGRPTIVVQNMNGATGAMAAEYIYNIAPKNGTQFAIMYPNALVDPLTGDRSKYRYDPTGFDFIGTADSGTRLCYTYHTSKVRTLEDAKTSPAIIGGTTRAGPGFEYSMLLNGLAGTKLKAVTGYKGAPDLFLAMERGEIEGMCGIDASTVRSLRPEWLGSKTANFLVQFGLEPDATLLKLGVPSIFDFVKAEDRAVVELLVTQQVFSRPYIAPPGTAPAQLAELRKAFDASHKDPELLAEAAHMKLAINPKSGEDVAALVKRMYGAPKELVARMTRTIRP